MTKTRARHVTCVRSSVDPEPGVSETVAAILEAHRAGTQSPAETVARTFARIAAHADPAVFISLRPEADAVADARALTDKRLPLYGVPVAIKDNIDVAGVPTTAACPGFVYQPERDAAAVARLKRAGAIVIGKTNLDQFATGLVGIRSPYGIPRNPFDPQLSPGGSSSGSAVAVAAGLVPLALGTDTAGSGRVPAGLNNIVGLKPSLGLVSTAGVVPACRSLDCVSLFALTTDDAFAALAAIAGPDDDGYSRALPLGAPGALPPVLRVAVPSAAGRIFFGDKRAQAAFDASLKIASALGARVVEIDFAPFLEAAQLLYEGPWVAERWAAVGSFIAANPDAVHPVTRAIIETGLKPSAVDTFRAFYRLAELRQRARACFADIDVLMVPTAPAAYTIAEVEADPVRLNSNLGTYTNFVNLLDLAGLAVPAAIAGDGTPFGVTFLAPAGQDALLASIGRTFHAGTGLPLGATRKAMPQLTPLAPALLPNEVAVAVVGAHLSGMPLNGELRARNARFLETSKTAPDYKLFALPGASPPKPGLLGVAPGKGHAIEVELWALSYGEFGRFVSDVPPPLAIGTLNLADGRRVKGFLVEADATKGARDISEMGGWRAFVTKEMNGTGR
jgi:allophanate hydrolase